MLCNHHLLDTQLHYSRLFVMYHQRSQLLHLYIHVTLTKIQVHMMPSMHSKLTSLKRPHHLSGENKICLWKVISPDCSILNHSYLLNKRAMMVLNRSPGWILSEILEIDRICFSNLWSRRKQCRPWSLIRVIHKLFDLWKTLFKSSQWFCRRRYITEYGGHVFLDIIMNFRNLHI